jgi:2-succinyl-5-enolpyruvyl-6-hydroxy-3-cyclohexene-1-carboxylate synthase
MDLDLDLDMEEPILDDELSEEDSMTTIVDEIFNESKVDKVLEKYFVVTEGEKKISESKKIKKFLSEKIKNVSVRKEIKKMSATIEQELTSEFLVKENNNIKFLGKTNKGNLVFESDGKQLKVSSKGELL